MRMTRGDIAHPKQYRILLTDGRHIGMLEIATSDHMISIVVVALTLHSEALR
jgi:hypothetical protein